MNIENEERKPSLYETEELKIREQRSNFVYLYKSWLNSEVIGSVGIGVKNKNSNGSKVHKTEDFSPWFAFRRRYRVSACEHVVYPRENFRMVQGVYGMNYKTI